jgi:dihydropteroate synthase
MPFAAGHRPVVVGVLNVTPDSFSDGGRFLDPDAACARVDRLLEEGADVIEVGGESTRPAGATYGDGFIPVDAKTQIARTTAAIAHAAKSTRVAIDTTSPEVARAAIEAGATIVNDVSCLADTELAHVCADRGAWLVLMHSRPGSTSSYNDVIEDVSREWTAARDRAAQAGVPRDRILMDPGLGFGKGADDNLRVLAGLAQFHALGHALYVGASRKAFIGVSEERDGISKSAPDDRIGGTVASCLAAAHAGAAVLRVHDVRALRQALAVDQAIEQARHV